MDEKRRILPGVSKVRCRFMAHDWQTVPEKRKAEP